MLEILLIEILTWSALVAFPTQLSIGTKPLIISIVSSIFLLKCQVHLPSHDHPN
jgi:hypothetical protein